MPYYVYVIELENRVRKTRKFIKANPNMDLTKPCVYVGQSVRPPEKEKYNIIKVTNFFLQNFSPIKPPITGIFICKFFVSTHRVN